MAEMLTFASVVGDWLTRGSTAGKEENMDVRVHLGYDRVVDVKQQVERL